MVTLENHPDATRQKKWRDLHPPSPGHCAPREGYTTRAEVFHYRANMCSGVSEIQVSVIVDSSRHYDVFIKMPIEVKSVRDKHFYFDNIQS